MATPETFSAETIPSRFDYQAASSRIYELWERGGYFDAEPVAGREPFTIVIPPPNVTGALHLGHALNNSLQDILIRMKRMQGYQCLWMPGTDHAGIATQAVVERRILEEEGLSRHDLGRDQLVARIWDWKGQYEARILSQLKQMGCSCDWRRTRFTLDETCARAVRETFFDLFGKRLIYRGKRLVNWDTFLQTAVSDDEVFHATVQGHFWHFRYPVIDPRPGEPTHVTIATTRPETMLGDTAVAVHPDPGGALDVVQRELETRLAAAATKDRGELEKAIDNIRARRVEMLPQLEQLSDMARAGRMLRLPLLDREIPLVADEWAKPELGSGCVKITPAHDPNDYEVAGRAGLPMINILNPDGTLNGQAGPYQGLTIAAARKQVVADLDKLGLLVEVEDREIDLAHSDRSKTPIEPYLADQWFVKMEQLAQSAMDAVNDERVRIHPARYRKGYLDWLSEKRDWPVSRQLWWGHQIPIWSRRCATVEQRVAWLEQLERLAAAGDEAQSAGVETQPASSPLVWQVEPVADGEPGGEETVVHVCVRPLDDQAAQERLEQALLDAGCHREEDVLDTWFSSALWPHSTLGWPRPNPALEYFYPTSTLITSRDIITLWVARMVLMGLNNTGQVPFREVFIHPKILDGEGETMSKSKGNGVDPLNVIQKFGADSLRFGLAYLTTETQDVRMPVQFECPQCEGAIDQTSKNRELPRIDCPHCQQPFRTQWARSEEDLQLPLAAVLSERFEVARNFCNKLWNAARFTLMNLEGYTPAELTDDQLAFEDRWMLSRLATVSREVTEHLEQYHYADAARTLYSFAWDEFCSYYVEITKTRLDDAAARPIAQRMLAYALDCLLRLLHPMIPYITEEIWQLLAQAAPRRGLETLGEPPASIMVAVWPRFDERYRDPRLESQFTRFQDVMRALRDIRNRQNIAPRKPVEFALRCAPETAQLLEPLAPYFASMAQATCVRIGPEAEAPPVHAAVQLEGDIDVYVDLAGLIDRDAEIDRNLKEEARLLGQIQGKQKKLANENFVARAPAEVVDKERESLKLLEQQLATVRENLTQLRRLPDGE